MNYKDQKDLEDWLEKMAADSGHKTAQSNSVLCLLTSKSAESALQALQIGFAVLMDKPIALLVDKNTPISNTLKRIANGSIVTADLNDPKEAEEAKQKLSQIIKCKGAN